MSDKKNDSIKLLEEECLLSWITCQILAWLKVLLDSASGDDDETAVFANDDVLLLV